MRHPYCGVRLRVVTEFKSAYGESKLVHLKGISNDRAQVEHHQLIQLTIPLARTTTFTRFHLEWLKQK